MSGNRVEELEAEVRELEATIDGLTDELVETKERLGTIEEETGIEPDSLDGWGTRTSGDDETASADGSEDETAPTGDEHEAETDEADGDDEAADSSGDDIIVA